MSSQRGVNAPTGHGLLRRPQLCSRNSIGQFPVDCIGVDRTTFRYKNPGVVTPGEGESGRAPPPRAWLLLSGGIDSAASLAFYLKEGFHVECFHISFGQPASGHERAAAERVARHFNVSLTTLRWSGSANFMAGNIIGRNAFFFLGALIEIGENIGVLVTGIHAGTPYFDCSQTFLSSLQTVFDGYCDGRVQLAAPFIEWSKQQVFAFCKSEGVPIDLTYSCEKGTDQPCRECLSCRDRMALDAL